MLDEEYRVHARVLLNRAESYFVKERRIELYGLARDMYSNIKDKTPRDHRAIASTWRHIAITFFNSAGSLLGKEEGAFAYEQYDEAGKNYLKCIEYYQHMPSLEDEDFRELTELYIDLSDVCCHLSKHQDAEEALRNAMLAFNKIRHKTAAELMIGDPASNFKKFYEYIEQKTSTVSYLSSTRFKNYQHILLERHEDKQMTDMFNGVSMEEKPIMDEGALDTMMSGLSVSNSKMLTFAPIRLDRPCNDVDYRAVSIEYLRLTQKHINQGNTPSTIITYRQALEALRAIQLKTDHDLSTIKTIETQISCLEAQQAMEHMAIDAAGPNVSSLGSQHHQASGSLVSSIGIFGHQAANAVASGDMEGEESEFLDANVMH